MNRKVRPVSYIYLASPYSTEDSGLRWQRAHHAKRALVHYTRQGEIAFSPIALFHPLAREYALPTDFQYWQAHNLAMLGVANELRVLQLAGWEESVGVQGEISHASLSNIPVTYVPEKEIFSWQL
jgi:hypothetical protein